MAQQSLFTLRSKKRESTPGKITGIAATTTESSPPQHGRRTRLLARNGRPSRPAAGPLRQPTSLATKRKTKGACGEQQPSTLRTSECCLFWCFLHDRPVVFFLPQYFHNPVVSCYGHIFLARKAFSLGFVSTYKTALRGVYTVWRVPTYTRTH